MGLCPKPRQGDSAPLDPALIRAGVRGGARPPVLASFDETAHALANGHTTSRALIEAALARIDDGEGPRAFVRVYADQARAGADAADIQRRANRALGRYAGIPISIKDLFDVAGEPTPAGSLILADSPPAIRHAPAIQLLLAAGLIPIGRTNMTEFAFSGVGINPHHGTPLSPYDRATGHIPGGSSSGAAVSVSDGMAAAGLGTDTGGSCRIPAALCGIAGFKPTARRVPTAGAIPLSPSLDSVGPLAPTAACCAAIDAILAGEPDRVLGPRPLPGLRVVLATNTPLDHMDEPTERALDRTVARLDRAGVLIDHRPIAAFDMINEAHAEGGFAAAEAYTWHRRMLATDAHRYDPRVASRIQAGADMPVAAYITLVQARARIIQAFATEMAPYDAMLMPTVPIAPPPLAAFADDAAYRRLNFLLLRNPSAINFLDGCAISIPCHAPGDPPAGLTIAAPAMQDALVLSIAMAMEALGLTSGA